MTDWFNQALDEKPAATLRVGGADEIVAAVKDARRTGTAVGVRNTGHGPSVPADGAILLDTGDLDTVTIDPAARTATVGAGTRWQAVADAADPHGLAPLSGSNPRVGVVGYTLGGGMSLLGRRFGFAADRVRAMDVVTGAGEFQTVTDGDLFWGLRGSKDNLGIVTSMTFELVELPELVGGGLWFDDPASTLRDWARWADGLPPELSTSLLILPGGAPAHVRIAYTGTDLDALLDALPGRRTDERLTTMRYREAGSIHDEPPGPVAASDATILLRDLPAEAASALTGALDPELLVEVRRLGGAFGQRPAGDAAPILARSAGWSVFSASMIPPDGPAAARPAHAALHAALAPWSAGGGFVSYLGVDAADVERAYTAADWVRLRRLKGRFDPDDVLRVNHHIPPLR